MPLFGLINSKRKLSASLSLRKTQSTGNIDDSSSMVEDIVTMIKKPTTTSNIITSSSSLSPPPFSTDDDDHNHTTLVIKRHKRPNVVSILRPPSSIGSNNVDNNRPPTPPSNNNNTIFLQPVIEDDDTKEKEILASKLRNITACDMELLLSMETQARMDCQEEKEKKQQELVCKNRPCKIKFELPITPPRSKSPDQHNYNNNNFNANRQRRWSLPDDQQAQHGRSRLSRWSKLIKQQQQEEAQNNKLIIQQHRHSDISNNSEEDLPCCITTTLESSNIQHQQENDIVIGSKVKLFKRPLPIIGTVKYIGKVHFDTGEWLGIELDSRVGNTDGKMDGQRYFTTNLHCGIFVKREDAIKV